MKKICLLCGILVFFTIISIDCNAQMKHSYVGIHYEMNATLNARFGRINVDKGYYIVDLALPRWLVGAVGWKVKDENIIPVEQAKYFSMRGGRWFKIGTKTNLGFDLMWEFVGIATPPDSLETKHYTGRIISPLQIGASFCQSFGESVSLLIIPSYGYALGKTRNDDGKHHSRWSVEAYFQYKINWMTIYAGYGFAGYPKGLAVSYPYDAPLYGSMATVGIAVGLN
ncbi:MAG TPA: hypothetical protein PKN32_14185 [Bacteroidales bacterium]|nr:hypothetical protein [Bacteroidales bacterium]